MMLSKAPTRIEMTEQLWEAIKTEARLFMGYYGAIDESKKRNIFNGMSVKLVKHSNPQHFKVI